MLSGVSPADQPSRPAVAFGIFDHLDRCEEPLGEFYEFNSIPMRFAESLDRALEIDAAIVGSPATVRAEIERHLAETGCNYFVGRFVYGNLGHERARRSLDLFAREVLPHFTTR